MKPPFPSIPPERKRLPVLTAAVEGRDLHAGPGVRGRSTTTEETEKAAEEPATARRAAVHVDNGVDKIILDFIDHPVEDGRSI